jgi:hypothetical protein
MGRLFPGRGVLFPRVAVCSRPGSEKRRRRWRTHQAIHTSGASATSRAAQLRPFTGIIFTPGSDPKTPPGAGDSIPPRYNPAAILSQLGW